MNTEKIAIIENAFFEILNALGENCNREGLKETPHRVAKMFVNEIFSGLTESNEELCERLSKTFTECDDESEMCERFGDMVIVKNIPFYSTCEHHFVPFFGKAHVGYIPRSKVIGLSKIARLLESIAKRPQLQERITKDVATCMEQMLEPLGVMVVIEAEHLCMAMRGVRKPGSSTITSATRGVFKEDPATRAEFMNLIR